VKKTKWIQARSTRTGKPCFTRVCGEQVLVVAESKTDGWLKYSVSVMVAIERLCADRNAKGEPVEVNRAVSQWCDETPERDEIELVEHRFVYSFNHPDAVKDGPDAKPVREERTIDCAVGEEVTHSASAPGTGKVTYRITRIDEEGAWGFVIANSVRELTVAEVI